MEIKLERQSNIEFLRIVAMLMVLAIHANYWRIGMPTSTDAVTNTIQTFMRILIQHLASPCVDVFILISGYFGIRPKWKSILNLWFLLAFWGGVSVMYDGANSFAEGALRIAFPFVGWFIPAYLGLYLISPILNLYAQNVDGRFAVKYLIGFFIIQTLLEHVFPYCTIFGRTLFNHGYSILSFIGLYLLGRYVKFNIDSIPRHKVSSWAMAYAGIFVFSALTITILLALPGRMAHLGEVLIRNATENSSPIVIVGSFCLFMAFEGMRFTSRVVNVLSTSALGVFCFSDFSFYAPVVKDIYREHSGITVLVLDLTFIVGVYFAGVLIDQVRVYAWKGAVGLIKRRKLYESTM